MPDLMLTSTNSLGSWLESYVGWWKQQKLGMLDNEQANGSCPSLNVPMKYAHNILWVFKYMLL